jgi:hypothetical protein
VTRAGGWFESSQTRRWREMDSNCRYPEDKLPLQDGLCRSMTVPIPERDSPLSRRGTDSSNPSPSSGESANFRSLSAGRYPSSS